MALSFSDSPGSLFNRLGRLGKLLSEVRTYQSNQDTNYTGSNQAISQLSSEPDIQAQLAGGYIGVLNNAGDGLGNAIIPVAQAILNRMVFRDDPRANQTLTQLNVLASIQEVILQMEQQGATVLLQTVTATPTSITGTGNGVIVASVYRPQDGRTQELAFAEDLQVLCTSDSYTGGATAGNEGFSITGQGAQSDPFAFDWPLGSGSNSGVNAINGNSDNANGNLLTNSGFTDWTANVPDNWTLEVGTAGTNIAQETTIVFDNTGGSLRIIGDGSTLTTLSQTFDVSTGTAGALDDLSQYAINVWVRRDGVAPAAGALVVEVVDASDDSVLEDEGGNTATFTIDLTGLSTSFASYSGTFRTPAVMPDSLKIRLRLSTALTNGRNVYVDKMATGLMTRQYTGGPYLAVFSGSTNFVQGDYGTVAITNSRGAGGSLDTFMTLVDLLIGLRGNELLLPSAAVPSISDDLITD